MTSPTNEQQRVDVLAVMDEAIVEYKALVIANECTDGCEIHADTRAAYEADLEKLEAARAAVAELIEATSALCGQIEFRIDDPRNAMRDRVVMAIANVGGAK